MADVDLLGKALSSVNVADSSLYDVLWQCLSLISDEDANADSMSMLLDLWWSQRESEANGLCPLGHELESRRYKLVQANVASKRLTPCGCERPIDPKQWGTYGCCNDCKTLYCAKCKIKNARVLKKAAVMNYIKSTMIR